MRGMRKRARAKAFHARTFLGEIPGLAALLEEGLKLRHTELGKVGEGLLGFLLLRIGGRIGGCCCSKHLGMFECLSRQCTRY